MNTGPLYAAIDLHSDNGYVIVLDDEDRTILDRKLPNSLPEYLDVLSPLRERIRGVAVESTYNWYWLVDGLAGAGFPMRLVNTAAVVQYEGLKYASDRHDARWLAHLLRLGILPEGHIMPKAERAVRDLLRKRMKLVQQRTANLVSLGNLKARNEGKGLTTAEMKKVSTATIALGEKDPYRAKALESTAAIALALDREVKEIEKVVDGAIRDTVDAKNLRTIWGIGKILSATILLETGAISRFSSPGKYASYCRCVKSERWSNGKVKGKGNEKCGNPFLSWAFVEAANFAIRFHPRARAFYDRKAGKKNRVLALKAVAHKLARAAWYVLSRQEPFAPEKAFG